METRKENLKLILINKKKIEKLMDVFLSIYADFFDKRRKIHKDYFIEIDLEIYYEFINFAGLLVKINFTDNDVQDVNIKKIIFDLLNTEKLAPEIYYQTDSYDPLFYCYTLCQLFIVYPFILEAYYFQELKQKKNHWHIDKINYYASLKISPKITKTIKIFDQWDLLEQKIERFTFEENEKHELSLLSFNNIKNLFSVLMNNFILIKYDTKKANKVLLNARLFANMHWIIIAGVVFIATLIALICVLAI